MSKKNNSKNSLNSRSLKKSKARSIDYSKNKTVKVAIIMGSRTDWKTMKDAQDTLSNLGVASHAHVVSAHRTPEFMQTFAQSADKNGYEVIIAGAGGAAHLPGMVASLTQLPVIGVPVCVGKLKGLDALLSVVQMPKGVPVACVAVDNAQNAALLAARILAIHDSTLSGKLKKLKSKTAAKVRAQKLV
jgi:5-(carboxyamino)imidazole ribonucleotide mutase